MKKLFLILLTLFLNLLFSQGKRFIYEYKSISDSTDRNKVLTEIMALNVSKNRSEYFLMEKFKVNSTNLAYETNTVNPAPPPPQHRMNSDRIIKYGDSGKLEFIKLLNRDTYLISQLMNFNWNLKQEFETVLGYKVQKATTKFGGRTWTAWFSKDIPIQDGPHKFSGLPGLILKIEDSSLSHIFELTAIQNAADNFIYPELKRAESIKINNQQYIKVYKKYRENPAGNLLLEMPDYTDGNGKTISMQKYRFDREKSAKERISKDNNILELDLIK